MDTQVPGGVPTVQSRMWSHTEDAADSAELSLRAAMMAAPRCRAPPAPFLSTLNSVSGLVSNRSFRPIKTFQSKPKSKGVSGTL